MQAMGFRPPGRSAVVAGFGEAGSGALLALGLATPAAGAARRASCRPPSPSTPAGFFAQGGGYEYPAFLGFTAAAIGLTGPGRYSLDHATHHLLNRPWIVALAFAGSAAGVVVVVGKRSRG